MEVLQKNIGKYHKKAQILELNNPSGSLEYSQMPQQRGGNNNTRRLKITKKIIR
jgi:hypothetical protein